MKYLIPILIIVVALMPLPSHAYDTGLSYAFSFFWQNGGLFQAGPYQMTTEDASVLSGGTWSLEIRSEANQVLKQYSFDPVALAVQGTFSLIIPIEYRGASAHVISPSGVALLTIDIRESRICNDNAVCESDAGEQNENCPTDCGAVAVQDTVIARTQTASIVQQVSFGERVGGLLFRISSAAAGLMLLIGIAQALDSRRRS